MSEITSNSAASKNEIKIEMTFEEAVEITQETYNNYQENADNKLDKLNIQKFPNQKGRFELHNKFHDEDSNFSGMTFIYDDENTNTVNVAIACRGSVLHWFNQNRFDEYLKKEKEENRYNDYEIVNEFLSNIPSEETKKDWFHNNLSILRQTLDTDSDNCAKTYATNILNKIKGDEKYKNKEINIITLGHSKGGREAQKQMLALINQKNDDKVSICCLTFNSAPMSKNDSDIGKHQGSCQNLTLTDFLGNFKDILTLSDKKYGNSCAYINWKSTTKILIFYILPLSVNIAMILDFLLPKLNIPSFIHYILMVFLPIIVIMFLMIFLIIKISRKYAALLFTINCIFFVILATIFSIINTFSIGIIIKGVILGILVFYISIIITIVLKLHLINHFTEETTYYKQLKNINVIKIIKAKTSQELKELQ